MLTHFYNGLSSKHFDLINRGIFAVFGGLLLTALITVNLSVLLPFARAEAVMSAVLLSFFIYAAIAIWAFYCVSIWRAWLLLLVASVLTGLGAGLL